MSTTETWSDQSGGFESNFQSPAPAQATVKEQWSDQDTERWSDTKPSPVPVPTDAMQGYIQKAGGGDQPLTSLLRIVSGIESGGGRNPATSNAGAVGVMQIKPATAMQYGFDPTRLEDPEYNVSVAAHILKEMLKQTHNNRVQAAIGYNQGAGMIGTPYNQLPVEGQHYAKLVAAAIANDPEPQNQQIKRSAPGTPVPTTPAHVTLDHVAQAGIPVYDPKAVARNPLYRNINTWRAQALEAQDWARRHPIQAFVNVEGFGQRAVDSIMTPRPENTTHNQAVDTWLNTHFFGGTNWLHPFETLKRAGVEALRPEDHDRLINSLEAASTHAMGLDVHPDQMHGMGKVILDTFTDVVTDPFTYIPGADVLTVGAKFAKLAARASHADGLVRLAVAGIGKTPQGGKLLSGLNKSRQTVEGVTHAVGSFVGGMLNVRPDLDHMAKTVYGARSSNLLTYVANAATGKRLGVPLFTRTGKLARMAAEHAASFVSTKQLQADTEMLSKYSKEIGNTVYGAVLPSDVQRHMLIMAWKYGTAADRSAALMHLANLGKDFMPNKAELKAFPMAKGILDFGGDVQKNFISAVIPAGKFASQAPKEVTDAIAWVRANAANAQMPFTKMVPGLANPPKMDELIKNTLVLYREAIRRESIAHATADLFQKYGPQILHHTLPGGGSISHVGLLGTLSKNDLATWFKKNVPDRAEQFYMTVRTKSGEELHVGEWLRKLSDLYKTGILGNPIPHGLVNVGMVTMLRANPYVAARGIAYALRGAPHALVERLEAMGGQTSYWRDPEKIVQWFDPSAYIAKAIKAGTGLPAKGLFESYFQGAQKMMDRLETGYRASYLQHLDQTLGVLDKQDPQFLLHELEKAQTLQTHIGDYANPSQLVSIMKGLGGLYDVFRLGVVPAAGTAAMKGRFGGTLAAAAKFEDNFSKEFLNRAHEYMFGPIDDYAKLIFAPQDFLTSVATLGPVIGGEIQNLKQENSTYHESFQQDMWDIMRYTVPGLSIYDKIVNPFGEDKAPDWIRFWEGLGGGHNEQEASAKKLHARHMGYVRSESR